MVCSLPQGDSRASPLTTMRGPGTTIYSYWRHNVGIRNFAKRGRVTDKTPRRLCSRAGSELSSFPYVGSLAVKAGGGTVEHRWGRRKATHQRVQILTVGGLSARGYITDISVSGAFVRTSLPARLLSTVQISLVTDSARLQALGTVAAQVVRKTPDGVGIEWYEQAPGWVDALAITSAELRDLPLTARSVL